MIKIDKLITALTKKGTITGILSASATSLKLTVKLLDVDKIYIYVMVFDFPGHDPNYSIALERDGNMLINKMMIPEDEFLKSIVSITAQLREELKGNNNEP